MTSNRCFTVEELAEILDLAGDDVRRRHLEECPRCRALLAEYREFLQPPAHMPGADIADADTRLHQALKGEIHGRPRHGRFFETPAFRMAMAVAAAACLLFAAYYFFESRPGDTDGIVLRNEQAPDAGPSGQALALKAPRPGPQGGVELSWHPAEAADSYEVRLYSAGLEELAVLGPVTDPSIVFRPAEILASSAPGTVLVWRVAALREGDSIAVSSPGTFKLP